MMQHFLQITKNILAPAVTILGNRSLGVVELAQLQQRLRVVPANLLVVLHATNSSLDLLGLAVPPGRAVLDGLVGVVDAEEDAVGADLVDDVLERVAGEVARGGDPDVLLKVVVDGLLAVPVVTLLLSDGPLDVLEPVVDAPEVKGDVLAQVAHDDLGLGMAVEDAVDDEAHQVQADGVGEGQGRADEGLALGVELVEDDVGGGGGVDVQRDVELLQDVPEGVVLRLVVEEVLLAVGARVLEVAEEGAVEPELLDAAGELPAGLDGVVHGQAREGAELVGLGLDLLSNPVVDLCGAALGLGLVRDALDTGDGEGHDSVVKLSGLSHITVSQKIKSSLLSRLVLKNLRVANTVVISELDTLVVDVADLPHVTSAVILRNVQGRFPLRLGLHAGHLIGFLECDLSQHFGEFSES